MKDVYESLIDGLMDQQYGVADQFISPEIVARLRYHLQKRYEQGIMHEAGIGNRHIYRKNKKVRGDLISWIEPDQANEDERKFLLQIGEFVDYLNYTCYTGIRDYEFHYAIYFEGSYYHRHKDQFKSDWGRKFSLVTYLNDGWEETDGGELIVYLEDGEKKIQPQGGRAVFFRSDEVEHEVMSAKRTRMSITGWLKDR